MDLHQIQFAAVITFAIMFFIGFIFILLINKTRKPKQQQITYYQQPIPAQPQAEYKPSVEYVPAYNFIKTPRLEVVRRSYIHTHPPEYIRNCSYDKSIYYERILEDIIVSSKECPQELKILSRIILN